MGKAIIVFQVPMVLSIGESLGHAVGKQALTNLYTDGNKLPLITPVCCYTSVIT